MSFQQFPPAGDPTGPFGVQPPIVQQPSAPFATPDAPRGRRKGLIAAGVLLAAAGLAAGIVMFVAAGANARDSVRGLARAPIGCTTSLEFDEAGTFIIYVETVGSIGELRGDCPGTDNDYEYSGDDLPDVDVVLVAEEGGDVDFDRDESVDYDAGGFEGQSISTIEIDEPGDYEMTVTSDDDDFAIAVGKDPTANASTLRTQALIVMIVGVLLGAAMVMFGLRRGATRPPPPTAPSIFDGSGQPSPFEPFRPAGVPPMAPMPAGPSAPPSPWQPVAPPAPPPSSWPPPPTG